MSTPGIAVQTDGNETSWDGTAGDDSFEGSNIAESFYLGLGDDVLFASGGDDNIFADLGDDWFDGGEGRDTIYFDVVGGIGNSFSSPEYGVVFDLAKTTQDLGYWGTKTVFSVENVFGSGKNDKLFGNKYGNELTLQDGNDFADGRKGNDTIDGINGRDTIVGGRGADVLAGYSSSAPLSTDGARDIFRYLSIADSGVAAGTYDVIFGTFVGETGDKIDLKAIDANGSAAGNGTFVFIGAGKFHANSTGEVQVKATGNANEYMVKIDTDLDKGAEMSILVRSTTALDAGDFIL
jgi:Ca2+-binding RTX toxin-like protein